MGKTDPALRILISGACIAVIAGTGYYLLGEYHSYQRTQEAQTQSALKAVFRESCLNELANLSNTFGVSPAQKNEIANCLYLGALSEAEVTIREQALGVYLR